MTPTLFAALSPLLAVTASPLLPGLINRTKAFFAGRQGAPLLQPYYDLAKLLGKGAVYSETTSWVFRAGPVVGLAALLLATTLVPFAGQTAWLAFPGDLVLLAYLLGLARWATVLAALDTGSAFEGMGASREVQFAALAELPFLLALAALACLTGSLSLSGIQQGLAGLDLWQSLPVIGLVSGAIMVVFLTENARIPVDDPNTHLELTMIHEVMVLDHGGPDLAMIHWASALKLWILGSVLTGILLPVSHQAWLNPLTALAGLAALALATGVIESTMARMRLLRVPGLLAGAAAMALLAVVVALGGL